MNEPVISISDLTRRFGAKTALNSVSLAMPRGAVYGLVGANGAGKTTLIKHILGLLQAESRQGTIVMCAPLDEIKRSHSGQSLDEIFVSLVGAQA